MSEKELLLQEYLIEKLKGTLKYVYSFKTFDFEQETFRQFKSRKTNPNFRVRYKVPTKRK